MKFELTAVFKKVEDGYIASIAEIRGVNTQGATLAEAQENLEDALNLVLEANREITEQQFAGSELIRMPLRLSS